ncbi:hypothetical protein TUM20985_25960 [Mycobacterium antarcticum]|uniref:cupredoxin domain-containing protein n=1 Tax=unclassified Mycolicibacterium TaxID=2636767 RepID=UPI00239B2150|nr:MULTISPECIES: cupredoxin domain-containing protein [unclassified Mycolicibacterium]BDX32049.1 hypothetical protein TUM20985_25960 [Mycolicibacterium sp. TUM20985]GLP75353.1 hypothetical protein TUM20983_24630 [Mycolicibacterium sp. TUM20983]GLP84383.1 hypothetical protein TUM20984_58030 [Mycolicibacterium sp. TUM20984]
MTTISTTLGTVLVTALLATACSSTPAPRADYGASPVVSSAPAVAGPTITIKGMAFGDPLTVSPGAVVTIVNDDSMEHSVTSKPDAGFDTDVDGGSQQTFTAPTRPGQYPFICTYHPNMKGTLIVT